jgi:hypothetical protein
MLTINYNSTDLSLKLEEYALPSMAITLLSSEFIYLGYYKPISNVYLELVNSVTSASTMAVKYETASGFVDVVNLVDHTNGLGSSGKISWETDKSLQISSTLFGVTRYWYKLSVDISTVAMTFLAINVLFSNDKDLVEEYPGIMDQLPTGNLSFVNFHSSARKDIVQVLRKKYSSGKNLLTQYDLLDNEEVRLASKFLTLSKIFEWLSDAPADKWEQKSKLYYNKYADYINNITLTVDVNDDGVVQEEERANIQFVRLVRE